MTLFDDLATMFETAERDAQSNQFDFRWANEINANLEKAVNIAEKVAPYRHHRLAGIKVDTKSVIGRDQHKSLEHLKAQMQKHFERLAPVLDLEAIMVSSEPSDGVGNRELDISAAVIDTAPKKEDLN